MTKKTITITVLGISAVLAGAVWAGLALFQEPTPVAKSVADTPLEVAQYMASEGFSKLSAEQKKEYFHKAGEKFDMGSYFSVRDQLTEEQRRTLRQNMRPMFHNMMEDRVNKYFELPQEQREAYLDEMIDRMQEMRRNHQANRRNRDANQSGQQRRRGISPERFKNRIEKSSPEDRAKRVEFMKAMRERMKKRGISFGRHH